MLSTYIVIPSGSQHKEKYALYYNIFIGKKAAVYTNKTLTLLVDRVTTLHRKIIMKCALSTPWNYVCIGRPMTDIMICHSNINLTAKGIS